LLGKRSLLVLRFASREAGMDEPGSAEAREAVFTQNMASCHFCLANAVCWCCASHPAKQPYTQPGSAEARGAFGFFDLLGNALP
jgi:hypothetical protein